MSEARGRFGPVMMVDREGAAELRDHAENQ